MKPGTPAAMPAQWLNNGAYMVLRRLEQKVPEFHAFVAQQAAALGVDSEMLVSRMVGRWTSGAPIALTPLQDDTGLGPDTPRNNDFVLVNDPFQRACPYAAHLRKTNPRDDIVINGKVNKAAFQVRRIIRAGNPFGPELDRSETTTAQSRRLMFVCYQTSIPNQFEFVQSKWANSQGFVLGMVRPTGGGGGAVTTDPTILRGLDLDLIIGQAAGGGGRLMDEPVPNYPTGDRRSTLDAPQQFVVLTAAALLCALEHFHGERLKP